MVMLEYSPRMMRDACIEPAALPQLMAAAGFVALEFSGVAAVAANLASVIANEQQRNLLWIRRS